MIIVDQCISFYEFHETMQNKQKKDHFVIDFGKKRRFQEKTSLGMKSLR